MKNKENEIARDVTVRARGRPRLRGRMIWGALCKLSPARARELQGHVGQIDEFQQ